MVQHDTPTKAKTSSCLRIPSSKLWVSSQIGSDAHSIMGSGSQWFFPLHIMYTIYGMLYISVYMYVLNASLEAVQEVVIPVLVLITSSNYPTPITGLITGSEFLTDKQAPTAQEVQRVPKADRWIACMVKIEELSRSPTIHKHHLMWVMDPLMGIIALQWGYRKDSAPLANKILICSNAETASSWKRHQF